MEPARKLPEDDQPDTRPHFGVVQGGSEGGGPRGNLHAVPPADDSGDEDNGAVDAPGLSARERADDRWGMGGGDSSSSDGDEKKGDKKSDEKSIGSTALGGLENSTPAMGFLEKKGTAAAESFIAAGGMYSGFEPKNALQRFLGSKITKRGGVAGGLTGLIIGGALLLGGISTGPMELIQLSHVLQQSFSRSDQESSSRLGNLFRFARFSKTGDIGETRVTMVGSKIFGTAIQQLDDVGISFTRDKLTGRPTGVEINQDKLSKSFPELEGMKSADAASFIEKQLSLPEGSVNPLVSSDNQARFTVDLKGNNGIGLTRALTKSSLKILGNNWLLSAIKARYLNIFFNAPSLLHPFSKARAAAEQKAADTIAKQKEKKGESKQQAQDEASVEAAEEGNTTRFNDITNPVADKGAAAAASVEDEKNSILSKLGAVLTITGGACIAYNTAHAIAEANHYIVYAPAAAEAMQVIAGGEEARMAGLETGSSSSGITTSQVGSMMQGLGNVWNSKALKSLEFPQNAPTGEDLPIEYQQAFSGKTGANEIENDAAKPFSSVPGGASVACSTVGLLVQAGLAVAASAFSEVLSGGLDTPGLVAAWTAKTVASGVIFGVATGAIIHIIEKVAIHDKLPQTAFRDAAGGGLLAFGSRAAANITSVSSGGISLLNDTTTFIDPLLAYDDAAPDGNFTSESTFARLFNMNDYNSLAGRLASYLYTSSWSEKIGSLANGLLNVGSLLGGTFSSLLPSASAAAGQTATYNWGFSQDGIPDTMLNDPNLADPYANAEDAAQLFDNNKDCGHGSCISMANTCFGDNVAKDASGKWDVTEDHMVDTSSSEYEDAGCRDIGPDDGEWDKATTTQQDWQRTIMFVFDTRTMNAAACATSFDDQSCSDSGMNGANTGGSVTGSPITASGSAAQLATQLLNEWGKNLSGNSVVKSDLTATSQGQTITNSDTCGKTVSIDPDLLQVLLTATTQYKLFLDNIISGHGCDQFLHPKGRASDIGGATNLATGKSTNFTPGTSGDDQQLDRAFYVYIASILPKGGEMGQDECAGRTGLTAPPGITFFSDTCTHQHIDMGNP